MMVLYTLMLVLLFVVLKGYRVRALEMEKPEAFSKQQKANLLILLCVILVVIGPALLMKVFPNVGWLAAMNKYADIGFASVIASLFVLAF